MATTVKADGKAVVTVDSDDRNIEERLARYAVELITASQPVANGEWQVAKFLERCSRHESQAGLIAALVERGRLTKSLMVEAAKKKSGRELAGCRGSMSKNAIASKFPADWWKDSYDHKVSQPITELRPDVREALRAGLAAMGQ